MAQINKKQKGKNTMNLTNNEIFNWIQFGKNNPQFEYEDWKIILKVARLAKKHHRQCENDCNGAGFLKGVHYTTAFQPKEEHNGVIKSAYVNEDITIFDREIERLETLIDKLLFERSADFKVEFQRDPRGATVKLTLNGNWIPLF